MGVTRMASAMPTVSTTAATSSREGAPVSVWLPGGTRDAPVLGAAPGPVGPAGRGGEADSSTRTPAVSVGMLPAAAP